MRSNAPRPDSPYTPLEPARGINFAGRDDLVRKFRQRAASGSDRPPGSDRHLLLVGSGGVGKTSLLLRLQSEFCRLYPSLTNHAIYLNLRDYSLDAAGLLSDLREVLPRPSDPRSTIMTSFGLSATATTDRLAEKLRRDFLDSISIGFPAGVEIHPGTFTRPQAPRGAMSKQLALLLTELSVLTMQDRAPTLVLIDELGMALQIPGAHELVHALSRLMQASVEANNANLLLVFAVRPDRKGQLEHDFLPDLFDPGYIQRCPLRPLTRAEAIQAVLRPAREAGVVLSTQLASDLVALAGRHPYYLQIACSQLWDHLAKEGKLDQQTVQLPRNTIAAVVEKGQAGLFQDFNSDEQYVLKVLARAVRPLSAMEIKQMVEEDDKDDVIDVDSTLNSLLAHKHRPITAQRQQDGYAYTHSLFREYVRTRMLSADEIQAGAVQAALDAAGQLVESGIISAEQAPLIAGLLRLAWKHRHKLRTSQQQYELLVKTDLLVTYPERWTWATTLRAVSQLMGMLESSGGRLEEPAAMALSVIGAPAVGPLLARLQYTHGKARHSLFSIVARIGDESAEDVLLNALHEEDEHIRLQAISGLAKIASARAVDAIAAATRDELPSVRRRAVSALGTTDESLAAPALIRASLAEDPAVRQQAVTFLGRIGGARAVHALIRASRDPHSDVRAAALSALGQVGTARAVDAVAEALSDAEPSVRQKAIAVLAQSGDPRQEHALVEALRDDNPFTRQRGLIALTEVVSDRAEGALVQALRDDDAWFVRQMAIDLLAEIATPGAREAIIEASTDPHMQVRLAAISALAGVAGSPAADAVTEALTDEEPAVRCRAVEVLGQLRGARATGVLLRLLRDDNPIVQDTTVMVLRRAQNVPRTPDSFIHALLHDPDGPQRRVIEALAKAGDYNVVGMLEAVASDACRGPAPPVARAIAAHILSLSSTHKRRAG